ncbi:MAG: SpoIIE family protein phosphatase [Candidatus Cyclonatronum sp.]|uniref:PP2C family protein-serine/threonine phosphatase n=1 Tax=Cyclonatronum sp. TaxID=3024185 RepID=UPI0025BCBDB1|nr:SpoIIE family protein phosphatase [Cyclonatronum sp.]MCC5935279.1 SpoIIE family protein phosphatase [Balneolales bacterium]MCH8487747.1 SpoIIE family protein phosphatase [Cyclonatronum sp.]
MSLPNESRSALTKTKNLYRAYTTGMSREQFERDFQSDSKRLKALYKEALGDVINPDTGEEIGAFEKTTRLIGALTKRMNPTRRLVFGASIVGFGSTFVFSGLVFTVLLPLSFTAMATLLLLELLEKFDVKEEIDLAKDIQISLLPSPGLELDGLKINSFANTASDVGGDYVDVIETEAGIYYIIADVSGKGLSASLYMVRFQALVHLLVRKLNPTPKELFLELNDYIKSYRTDKTFITACAAFFPKDENYFQYVRAGHNPPILFRAKTDSTELLQTPGFALGMTRTKRLESFLQESRIPFEAGDTVLFYTDGVNEARNTRGDEFGLQRLRSLMDIYGSLEASTIVGKIQSSVENFIGEMPTVDDITYSCIKSYRKPQQEADEEAEVLSGE